MWNEEGGGLECALLLQGAEKEGKGRVGRAVGSTLGYLPPLGAYVQTFSLSYGRVEHVFLPHRGPCTFFSWMYLCYEEHARGDG